MDPNLSAILQLFTCECAFVSDGVDQTPAEYSIRQLLARFGDIRSSWIDNVDEGTLRKIESSLETLAHMLPVYERFARLLELFSKLDRR